MHVDRFCITVVVAEAESYKHGALVARSAPRGKGRKAVEFVDQMRNGCLLENHSLAVARLRQRSDRVDPIDMQSCRVPVDHDRARNGDPGPSRETQHGPDGKSQYGNEEAARSQRGLSLAL